MPSVIMRAGAELTFETLVADRAPVRRRAEDTLIRVLDGVVRLTVDGCERLLRIGDEAIVPAGAPHRISGAGGAARLVSGYRPARG